MSKPHLVPTAKAKSADLAEIQQKARDLYVQYKSINEISQQLGVSVAQLTRWRREQNWLIEREAAERGLLEDGFGQRKLTIARIMNTTTEQLERGLKHISTRHEPPTLPEIEKLSAILANLDRIGRLDAGKATENVNVRAKLEMTAEAVRQVILSDPARAFEPPQGVVIDVDPE